MIKTTCNRQDEGCPLEVIELLAVSINEVRELEALVRLYVGALDKEGCRENEKILRTIRRKIESILANIDAILALSPTFPCSQCMAYSTLIKSRHILTALLFAVEAATVLEFNPCYLIEFRTQLTTLGFSSLEPGLKVLLQQCTP